MTASPYRCIKAGIGALALSLLLAVPSAYAQKGFSQSGIASWYGAWHHGKITANGESFDMFAMTAAHKTLPLGCLVKVTRKDSGKSIIVRINDRGPYVKERILDLSYAAADSLGMSTKGISRVTIEVLSDKKGQLFSDSEIFFVCLDDDAAPEDVERLLSRLLRLGIYDAASLLHIKDRVAAIGPFASFEEAQEALTRVATTHPGACIMLAKKGSMAPAVLKVAENQQ